MKVEVETADSKYEEKNPTNWYFSTNLVKSEGICLCHLEMARKWQTIGNLYFPENLVVLRKKSAYIRGVNNVLIKPSL